MHPNPLSNRGRTARHVALVALLAFAPLVHAQPTAGTSAEFVTGGISKEEADYLRAQAASFPLEIVFARTTGSGTAFAADVALTVRDASGATVLSLPAAEPIVLARLAPGRYTVEAVYEGRVRTAEIAIGEGHQKLGLTW